MDDYIVVAAAPGRRVRLSRKVVLDHGIDPTATVRLKRTPYIDRRLKSGDLVTGKFTPPAPAPAPAAAPAANPAPSATTQSPAPAGAKGE